MGQQQLLLIILGVIVVGIASAAGIILFTDHAVSANRDAVTNDLVNLAATAQQYYRRPVSAGGGGMNFSALSADAAGFARLSSRSTNANGSFSVCVAGCQTAVTLQGVGVEKGIDGNPIKVQIRVDEDSTYISQLN